MTLRVIGAGLGRTGTTSLKVALELLLGDRCYHMLEVREHSDHADQWGAAYRGTMPDWDALFEGYSASVDWPAAPFWPQLAAHFPDALILLSTRDADSWWKSASSTIFPALSTYFADSAPDDGWTAMGVGMMTTFTPGWQDEEAAKSAYLDHNETVRRSAPPERLLEWTVEDGWEPICSRLGLAVPTVPFPHKNTTAEAQAQLHLDT